MVEEYQGKLTSVECDSAENHPGRRRTWAFSLLKLIIGLGLILLLLKSGRLDLQVIFIAQQHPGYFFAGILCCAAAFLVPIYRWWILARIQTLPIGGFDALRLTMIGYFFNTFIPGSSGGDLIRGAYTLRECPEKKAQALTVAVADRGLGLHAVVLCAVAAFFLQPHLLVKSPALKPLILFALALFITGLFLPLIMFWKLPRRLLIKLCGRIIGSAEAWQDAIKCYRQKIGLLSLAYLCSVINLLFNILLIHFMMYAIGSTPHLSESMLIVPLIILANTLPFTPGGIGVGEAASAGLFDIAGYPGGANAMLLARLIIIFYSAMGLPFFLMDKSPYRRQ